MIAVPILLVVLTGAFQTRSVFAEERPARTLTVIIDHSLSMKGGRIEAAKESTKTLLALMKVWRDAFPQEAGRVRFQLAVFGSHDNSEALIHPSPLTDLEVAEQKVDAIATVSRTTDFDAGFSVALPALQKTRGSGNLTLFLTDGEDEGPGPRAGTNYVPLGSTRFVIYGSRLSVQSNGWLSALPGATETHVSNPSDLNGAFIRILLEFIGANQSVLMRQGYLRFPEGGIPFRKYAEGPLDLVFATAVAFKSVSTEDGRTLSSDSYQVTNLNGLTRLTLSPAVPPGPLVLRVAQPSAGTDYVSFEASRIGLRFSVGNGCAVENSVRNIEVQFVYGPGGSAGRVVDEPDFLRLVSYRVRIQNQGAGKTLLERSGGGEERVFDVTPQYGSAGEYDLMGSWTYGISVPPPSSDSTGMSPAGKLCIGKDGTLVALSANPIEPWEGRDVRFEGNLDSAASPAVLEMDRIPLSVGNTVVPLIKIPGASRGYAGVIQDATPGRHPISFANSDTRFILALKGGSPAAIDVRKRTLVVRTVETASGAGDVMPGDSQGRMARAWLAMRDLFGHGAAVTRDDRVFTNERRIDIPVKLPYVRETDVRVPIQVSIERVLPDEEGFIAVHMRIPDHGPRLELSWQGPELGRIHSGESVRHELSIRKGRERSNIAPVRASVLFESYLMIPSDQGMRRLDIAPTEVSIDIATDPTDVVLDGVVRGGLWTLFFLAVAIVLFGVLLFFLVRRRRYNIKREIWDECKGHSPEDFYSEFPEAVRQSCKDSVRRRKDHQKFLPPADESDLARERRAFRSFLQEDGATADRSISANCTIGFLRKLRERLREPNLRDVEWTFAKLPDRNEIEIVSFTPDSDRSFERYIRTRLNTWHSYGRLRSSGTAWTFGRAPVATWVRNQGQDTFRRLEVGTETEIDNVAVIRAGPDIDHPLFIASVFANEAEITITVTGGQS